MNKSTVRCVVSVVRVAVGVCPWLMAFAEPSFSAAVRTVPSDLDLRTWRVETKNCTFSAESEFADRAPVYRVYRPMADREELVASRDGYLPLVLGEDFCDLFYYGEDTESYRAFLKSVKADRALTADFFEPGH